MSIRREIVRLLADGRFHSGTELGRRLGVSRAAVCKALGVLAKRGLDVYRVRGKGYRLADGVRPLDAAWLRRELAAEGLRPARLTVLDEVDSTNSYLFERMAQGAPAGTVCLAEFQSAGRGRRNRPWIASPYGNLLLSVGWRFSGGPGTIEGLSLAAGVAVAQALEDCGVRGVGLKWPNDILWEGRKLGGMLVDVHGEAGGPCVVVLGVGVNVRMAPAQAQQIDRSWVDLARVCTMPVDRTRLAARVTGGLLRMFRTFEREGFAPFRSQWEMRHVHAGRPVRLVTPDGATVSGRALGTDETGALLLLRADGTTDRFACGEISLRSPD